MNANERECHDMIREPSSTIAENFRRVALEKLRFQFSEYFGRYQLEDMHVELIEDFAGHLAARVAFEMFGKEARQETATEESRTWREVGEKVPATWWDHLKLTVQNRAPKRFYWFTIRFRDIENVRNDYHKHVTKVYHLCPHLPGSPTHTHLAFMEYDGEKGYVPSDVLAAARNLVDSYRNDPMSTGPSRAMYELEKALNRLGRDGRTP